MKKKIIALTLIIGMLFGGGLVWAEGNYKTIDVFFERINVSMNGEKFTVDSDSIVYNGAVYVPLRALSTAIGATVTWDGVNQMVDLDFIRDQSGLTFAASEKSLYQYIAVMNNQILTDMTNEFKNNQVTHMKDQVAQLGDLENIAKNLNNEAMAQVLDKLGAAVELIRSGWTSKQLDNYYLAWNIFSTNEASLNTMLKSKLADSTPDAP